MTYEEYKNNKEGSKKSIIKTILNKIFTIVVFVLLVMIFSNISPEFKDFVNDKILNSTLDFSIINKITNNITDVFENNNVTPVVDIKEEYEEYKDGLSYFHNGDVKVKDSGIVTFIGEKEGYGNTIIIQQSNGYHAWYGNIKENVKIYDYVEASSIIGSCEEKYYYVLYKDDKVVDLINES